MDTVINIPMHYKDAKAILINDFLVSKNKDLGDFAFKLQKVYDDISYELIVRDATSHGKKMTGRACAPRKSVLEKLVKDLQLEGDFTILEIDCQKEFYLILADIRDDLEKINREIGVKTRG